MAGGRRPRSFREDKSEFDHRVVDMRRVARVVKGGRRFSFRVTVVVGDRNGRVGVGVGKASDTALAIDKAMRHGKKTLMKVPLTKGKSIPHEVEVKFGPSRIMLRPGRRGLVAGSAVRAVLELAGVENVSAKILSRSMNKLNNARATLKALRSFNPRTYAA